jgi:hypothetical protein
MNSKWAMMVPTLALVVAAALWWTDQKPAQRVISFKLVDNCQLHQQTCHSRHQNVAVYLDITPKPIPISKTLSVNANISGVEPVRVQLDINGSNMYMGYNRIGLSAQPDGNWTGKSLLAFCTTDSMQWQLTVLIDLADGSQLQAPFLLTTPFKASE